MKELKYTPTERMFEGILTEINGGGCVIDFNGRMGQLKIPLRMLICDETPKIGQTVRFLMSYPVVID